MEAISKLYAEIGFEVNTEGLTKFSKMLSGIQNQIKNFSKTIKEIPGIDIKFNNKILETPAKEEIKNNKKENKKNKEKETPFKIIKEISELDTKKLSDSLNFPPKEEIIIEKDSKKEESNKDITLKKEEPLESIEEKRHKKDIEKDSKKEETSKEKEEKRAQKEKEREEKKEKALKEREEKRKQKEKEKENKRFERSLERLSKNLISGLGGIFAFALSAARKLVKAAADGSTIAMGMKDFSLVTGGDIEDLMQWTSLGAAVGGNSEQVKKMMQGLSSKAAQLRLGEGGAADTFKMLGLSAITDPNKMIGELLRTIKGHTVDEAVMSELLSALGLDPALTKKMAYATEKQLERAELLYKLTPKQEEVMRATLFREDITSLGDAIDSFKVKLASAFNEVDPQFINNILKTLQDPEFKEALESFAKLIIGVFKGIMAGLKWLYDRGGELGKIIFSQFAENEKKDLSGVKGKETMFAKAIHDITHFNERNVKEQYLDELARKSALRAIAIQKAQKEQTTQINGDIHINVANPEEAVEVMKNINKNIGGPIITDTTRAFGDAALGVGGV